jgi:hypothetical protein
MRFIYGIIVGMLIQYIGVMKIFSFVYDFVLDIQSKI